MGTVKDPSKFIMAIDELFTGVNGRQMVQSIMYLSIFEIRKILLDLGLDVEPYESTQLFRQVIPFKSLHYGPITK